uniref:Glycerophosphocholine acyltransferase 1 n=1 Tax=Ganoderma boninense TaxID=34458 RepID=A0A5K1K1Y3_9APHY|nr:N/A [Ganoderma boninense]
MATPSSSRPPSPPPPARRRDSSNGSFSIPFERFVKDEISDWASGFTLLDTMETYFDSHLDLLQRNLAKTSDRLKLRAEETLQDLKKDVLKDGVLRIMPSSNIQLEREVQRYKIKVSQRLLKVTQTWHSAKVVRTREKVTFFLGVMSLLFTALLYGMAPEWIHVAYTVQAAYYLPMRVYKYKKRAWHYFLFDLCYYINILDLIFIWVMPDSAALFVACYCLSLGSLASAVITWRNSLVFHDWDKVTSLFIHIYPPLVFSVIRHYYPDSKQRFPALRDVPHLQPFRALLLSSIIYLIWQLLYWKYVLIDRRAKVQSGQRITSFMWLLNDKRGAIGCTLAKIPPDQREISFMGGQLLYSIITELPAVFLLYDSAFWSSAYIFLLFAVSVWNGGGFYIEVFGRKFERELEALRKELAEVNARSERSSPTLGPQSDDDMATLNGSPNSLSPIVTAVEVSDANIPPITSNESSCTPSGAQ